MDDGQEPPPGSHAEAPVAGTSGLPLAGTSSQVEVGPTDALAPAHQEGGEASDAVEMADSSVDVVVEGEGSGQSGSPFVDPALMASDAGQSSSSGSPIAPDMDRSWSDKSLSHSKKKGETSAAAGSKKKPHPNQWTKRREAEAAGQVYGTKTQRAAAKDYGDKKKPHPNQWTYLRRDDPNRPKGANQYTVKKRLEALAAAAAEEAAVGVEDGEAAAAYAVALAQRQKAQMRPNVLARQAAKAAAAEGLSTPSSTKTVSTSGTTPVVKKKATTSGTASSSKTKETVSTSQSSTTQAKKKSTTSTSQKQSKREQQQHQNVDDDAGSTVSEDDRIYCVCQQLYDPERMMIACDRCDNWYHNDCVGIDDDDVEIVDQFICPNCASTSDRRTTWKPRCARPGCNSAALPLSKYCSDWCGLAVAASRLELASEGRGAADVFPEAFWDRVLGARKREARAFPERAEVLPNGAAEEDDGQDEARQLLACLRGDLAAVEGKRATLEAKMGMVLSRMEFLRFAVDRWEAMCIATARALAAQQEAEGGGEGGAGKGKAAKGKGAKGKKGAGAGAGTSSAEALCGFDVRLVWDDRDWESWVISEEGRLLLSDGGVGFEGGANELARAAEEGVVCLMMKKRCDRHSGWQKTREADFEAEQAVIRRRLDKLALEERRLRSQITDREESARFHAQGFHRPVAGLVLIEPPTPAPLPLKRTGSFKGGKKGRGKSKSSGARSPTPVPPVLEEDSVLLVDPSLEASVLADPSVEASIEPLVEPQLQTTLEPGIGASSMDEIKINGLGGHDEEVAMDMDIDEPVVVHFDGLA